MVGWGHAVRGRPAAGWARGAIDNRLSPTARGLSPSAKTCHDLPRAVSGASLVWPVLIHQADEALRGCRLMSLIRFTLEPVDFPTESEQRSVVSDLLPEKEVEGHAGPVTACHIGAEALWRWKAKAKRIEEEEETCGRGFQRGRRPAPNEGAPNKGPAPTNGRPASYNDAAFSAPQGHPTVAQGNALGFGAPPCLGCPEGATSGLMWSPASRSWRAPSGLCGSFLDRSPGRCLGLRWSAPSVLMDLTSNPVLRSWRAPSGLCRSFLDRSPGRCPGLRWSAPLVLRKRRLAVWGWRQGWKRRPAVGVSARSETCAEQIHAEQIEHGARSETRAERAERECRTRGASNADHALCRGCHTNWSAQFAPNTTVLGSKDDNLSKQAHTRATFGDAGRHIFGLGTQVGSGVLQDWRWSLAPCRPTENNPGERIMTIYGQAPAAFHPAPQIEGTSVAGRERLCNHDKKRQFADSTIRGPFSRGCFSRFMSSPAPNQNYAT